MITLPHSLVYDYEDWDTLEYAMETGPYSRSNPYEWVKRKFGEEAVVHWGKVKLNGSYAEWVKCKPYSVHGMTMTLEHRRKALTYKYTRNAPWVKLPNPEGSHPLMIPLFEKTEKGMEFLSEEDFK